MTETPRLIEPLESRIAPAIVIANPIFDQTATTGQTGVSIDLGKMLDASKSYRTVVELVTNFTLPGESSPGVIQIELFDDKAPISVANFLRYLNNKDQSADYDGVIFHRLVQGFVLQGGGNNSNNINEHIDTFATIHNEFDPNDPERSNLVQTVAMAKVAAEVGGGAHSATSEFFINLANNASNLDAQNGGFTVFGRVTDASMPVVNALGQLSLFNGAVPVQNYSGTGVPVEAQLIKIVDARVVSSAPGDDGGATFSVKITDAATGDPTKLVTSKFNEATNELDLKYSPTLSGVAKVTVTVSKPGEIDVEEEFLVTVKPNLISEVSNDGLKSTFVPGDKGTAKVLVTNNGGALAKGKVNVKLYLSESVPTQQGDGEGFALDTNPETGDRLLAVLNNVNINIKPGKSATIPVNFTVTNLETGEGEMLIDGTKYRLLAVVEPVAGSTVQELFGDDNVGNFRLATESLTSPAVLRTFDLAFGEVGGRGGVPITVQDGNGENITLKLAGPGTGSVVKNADGTLDISLSGTTAASKLSVVTGKGLVADIDDLFINDTIGSVSLGNTHLHGHFTASGGAKSIIFGDLGNTDDAHPENNLDKTLSIGAFPIETQKLALKMGEVNDYTLVSDMPIVALSANGWLNGLNTAANTIGAPAIGTMKIAGDLEANVVVAGTTKLSLLSVTGAMRDISVKSGGDVSKIQVGDLIDSEILVGVNEKPDAIGDFALAKTIGNLTVKGTMANSVVAAAKITAASIANVDANAGTEVGGLYADAIKSYVRKGPVPAVKKTNLDAPTTNVDTLAPNYEVRVF